jgi:hypothetical protein
MEMFSYEMSTETFRKMLEEEHLYEFRSGPGTGEVEFPVWLLCRDGLKVPPFLHHEAGDQSLQLLGMNAALWERWFRRVVSAHSLCLSWEIKEPKVPTGLEETEQFQQLMLERDIRFYLMQSAQRQKVLAQLDDDLSLAGASPVSIWDGNQVIKDKIAELWEQYILSPNRGNTTSPWDTVNNQMVIDASQALIHDLALGVFQVFYISYPETVRVTVGASILVIGVNSSTTTEQLIFHLTEGAKQLAEAK